MTMEFTKETEDGSYSLRAESTDLSIEATDLFYETIDITIVQKYTIAMLSIRREHIRDLATFFNRLTTDLADRPAPELGEIWHDARDALIGKEQEE